MHVFGPNDWFAITNTNFDTNRDYRKGDSIDETRITPPPNLSEILVVDSLGSSRVISVRHHVVKGQRNDATLL